MPAERAGGREAPGRSDHDRRDPDGRDQDRRDPDGRYKWVALSNTTLGMLVATINSSIVIISLPAIFRGIHLDPLRPGNVSYLLWMLMGYLVVSAVLVVAFGRLGDIYGRVRMYNAGFLVFTAASIVLAFTPGVGSAAALGLIALRIVQGVGGALLMANSMAILTDAFPVRERGMALGINQVAALAGSFLGLLIGGLLADTNWRAVFLVSVPFGIFGTVWGYLKLREGGQRGQGRIDWGGNLTFGIGLIAVLVGITYGIQPYGGHTMGWTSPLVLTLLFGGIALLGAFLVIERRSDDPLFHLDLFRIRAFSAGNLAGLLASVSRGGLQFMLIIWLQGIWLPLHGYSFASTPLWAGIYMIPLTLGFLVAGPVSGWLSDHYGARPFATGGMLLTAASFAALTLLPIDFPYWVFAVLLLANGIGSGLFAAPNTAGIMNAVPARQRGAASGMRATFQNAGFVLSIGLFFSLMIAGLAARLPTTLYDGLTANGVPPASAERIAHLPPVGSLFAAFLGYNPIRTLLGPAALEQLSPAQVANLTGTSFFPRLIAEPFQHGLAIVFLAALVMSLVAAAASWLRGGRYVHEELEAPEAAREEQPV
ncbi:MAG: MFS transporter [Actinomycetota bacterium]|jgi:MFS family permease